MRDKGILIWDKGILMRYKGILISKLRDRISEKVVSLGYFHYFLAIF